MKQEQTDKKPLINGHSIVQQITSKDQNHLDDGSDLMALLDEIEQLSQKVKHTEQGNSQPGNMPPADKASRINMDNTAKTESEDEQINPVRGEYGPILDYVPDNMKPRRRLGSWKHSIKPGT